MYPGFELSQFYSPRFTRRPRVERIFFSLPGQVGAWKKRRKVALESARLIVQLFWTRWHWETKKCATRRRCSWVHFANDITRIARIISRLIKSQLGWQLSVANISTFYELRHAAPSQHLLQFYLPYFLALELLFLQGINLVLFQYFQLIRNIIWIKMETLNF